MRIEEGKYYRAANGGKVGPVSASEGSGYPFEAPFNGTDPVWYRDNGACPHIPGRDIVALWTDEGPVRTVTRQEIIPGTYDGVSVADVSGGMVNVCLWTKGMEVPHVLMDADQLERAAAVLTALAGALRDEQ